MAPPAIRAQKIGAGQLISQALLLLVASVGMLWAGSIFQLTSNTSVLSQMAEQIWSGEVYRRDALERVLAGYRQQELGCSAPDAADAAATVAYARAERTLASGDRELAREDLRMAGEQARAALSCSPHRAHLWFLLFWARTALDGYHPDALPFLSMSYQLAPHEAWLATFRLPLAMGAAGQFPKKEQEWVIGEFRGLLKQSYFATAARALVDAGPEMRPRLMAEIEATPVGKRTLLARRLEDVGAEIEIAGIPDRERQRWEPYVSSLNKVRELLRRLDGQTD